jgi:hypothetical protein
MKEREADSEDEHLDSVNIDREQKMKDAEDRRKKRNRIHNIGRKLKKGEGGSVDK